MRRRSPAHCVMAPSSSSKTATSAWWSAARLSRSSESARSTSTPNHTSLYCRCSQRPQSDPLLCLSLLYTINSETVFLFSLFFRNHISHIGHILIRSSVFLFQMKSIYVQDTCICEWESVCYCMCVGMCAVQCLRNKGCWLLREGSSRSVKPEL